MNKAPKLGWQSWSPPFEVWHGFPRWDYSPLPMRKISSSTKSSTLKNRIHYWCSWYAYGWDINDHKIMQTLQVIKKNQLNFTHIIIDDGWTIWGDWSSPDLDRFPNIAKTIQTIHRRRLKAGLWLAPFLANKKSMLYQDHPDWFIEYRNRPVQGLKTIPVWEWLIPQQYLLDLNNVAVKKYMTNFIDVAVKKWKVDLFKLDFLYAPYFNPHLRSENPAHNQVAWLFAYIKKNYPKVQTIACGAPFSSTLGLASIIRISKDTSLPPPFPSFINRLFYIARVKMLELKIIAAKKFPSLVADPDVRMFGIDNKATNKIWDSYSLSVLAVGDDLTSLSLSVINRIKLYLQSV